MRRGLTSVTFLSVLWVLICLLSTDSALWAYAGGTGEPNDPYQIATAEDLIELGNDPNNYDRHFILTADVDLSGYSFDRAVIAPDMDEYSYSYSGVGFSGSFDGRGYLITGLVVDSESEYAGLFGLIAHEGEVLNVHLSGGAVHGWVQSEDEPCGTGGLAGENRGVIRDCHCELIVNGNEIVGGLVGENQGRIICCMSNCRVNGASLVGGVVGYNNNGSITASYSMGQVHGGDGCVGGLVGYNRNGFITSSYSISQVDGSESVGGLVGINSYSGSITSSFLDTETSGLNCSDGGIGLTTAEMMNPELFGLNGWANDPNWVLDAGRDYPRLSWEGTPGQIIPEPSMDWIDGDGTVDSPYQICSVEQLAMVGKASLLEDKHFELVNDLDLLGLTWSQAVIPYFSGRFDGNGHVIRHLTLLAEDYVGLFGVLGSSSELIDLGLEAVDVNGTGSYVGGLVGYNEGKVSGCFIIGLISGDGAAGGLVGCNAYGSVTSSYSIGQVSGRYLIGGLIGYNRYGSITSSYSVAQVSGNVTVGGLVGYDDEGSIIWSCSTGTVSGGDDYVGGLVGHSSGSIASSYSTSTVSGGSDYVGGLVGRCLGSITSSYSTGMVYGMNYVGGLVGESWFSDITLSYSIGQVVGGDYVGGLAGHNYDGSITGCLWDTETSGTIYSDGGMGLTTAEMMNPEFIALNGWADDPNWVLDAGEDYPRLPWEGTSGQPIPEPSMNWIDGCGTAEAPYQISAVGQLEMLGKASLLAGKSFKLINNLDLSGLIWHQAVVPHFSGHFNGNGHVIRNLTIQGTKQLGLFGFLESSSEITDLGLEAVDVNGTGSYVGGLVGYNEGKVSDCFSIGLISGDGVAGGLVGRNAYGSITSSYSIGQVSGGGFIGGLVGSNGYGSIMSSYSISTVCGENEYVGGLAGYNSGSITSSNSTGSVGGGRMVGGLVGFNDSGWSAITSCYSTAVVDGNKRVGGLVGGNRGNITSSYSDGQVTGNEEVGGLVGWIYIGNMIMSSFWNTETSGLTESADGMGLTTMEMHDLNTFLDAGWDFVGEVANGTGNFWQFSEGCSPQLAVMNGLVPVVAQGCGTADDSYLIRDANELGSIWYRPNAYYRLTESIDLSGITWSNAVIPVFHGNLDGNGHTIHHLHIEGGGCLGLIGQLYATAKVSNLGLEAVYVNGTESFVGALVGCNSGSIMASFSSGQVTGLDGPIGGLVGKNVYGATIMSSYSTVWVNGDDYVGGLVGSSGGHVASSYSTGRVIGNNNVGGLVGSGSNIKTTACFWDVESSQMSQSDCGFGLTTDEMQDINTYLDAGWDFMDETANGTEDIWWMPEEDYPRLWWE